MSEIKLNLGCGLTAPERWVNIDCSWNAKLAQYPKLRAMLGKFRILPKYLADIPWPKNIKIYDVRKGLPYPNNSVRCIYMSHFLEHLTREEARKLLVECYRVLKHSGVIRIIVPDLMDIVTNYLEQTRKFASSTSEKPPVEHFLESLNFIWKPSKTQLTWLQFFKRFYDKNTHKWMYDETSLRYLLIKIGFQETVRKQCFESLIKDIRQLDSQERFKGSVCLEAIKR